MTFVKTNLSGYFKDPATGFIVNRNEADFKLYETQKQLYKERIRAEIETRKALGEIEDLKKQMPRPHPTYLKCLFPQVVPARYSAASSITNI